MADPLEHFRQRMVERIRQIIVGHRCGDRGPDGGFTCSCGAAGLSDHPRHVAEQILEAMAVKPRIDEAKKRVRYASAWIDFELSVLEGAEC